MIESRRVCTHSRRCASITGNRGEGRTRLPRCQRPGGGLVYYAFWVVVGRYASRVSERRRRTMGERGALPDPIMGIRYGQHCNCGQYCDCPTGDGPSKQYYIASGPKPEPKPRSWWDQILSWFS